MSDFKAKNAPKSNFGWRSAQTCWENLQRSPDSLAGFNFKVPTSSSSSLSSSSFNFKNDTVIRCSLLREGSGEEQMGRDGSGRKGRGWSVVESNNFLKIQYTLVKGAIAKSAVYDCLVPFDDKSTENQSL